MRTCSSFLNPSSDPHTCPPTGCKAIPLAIPNSVCPPTGVCTVLRGVPAWPCRAPIQTPPYRAHPRSDHDPTPCLPTNGCAVQFFGDLGRAEAPILLPCRAHTPSDQTAIPRPACHQRVCVHFFWDHCMAVQELTDTAMQMHTPQIDRHLTPCLPTNRCAFTSLGPLRGRAEPQYRRRCTNEHTLDQTAIPRPAHK
jgi:hypothetical protein